MEKELIEALHELQKQTIGLFWFMGRFELVLMNIDGLLKTITIGELGGLTTSHIPIEKGIFKRFPDNRTLWEMKKDPFSLDAFCKSFKQYEKALS